MRLKHESTEKLKKQILQAIGGYLDLKKHKVFFFGSRINGEENEYSDIDLGIEGQERLPARTFMEIKEAMENLPVLYTVDVVDFKRVPPDFHRVAMKNIELL